MPTITSAGIGSGLDVNGLVTQLIAAERTPTANRLDKREAALQAQVSALGSFKSALADFRTAAGALDYPGRFTALKASVGDGSLFSATTSSAAAPGSYSIDVQSLAQAQRLSTARYAAVTDAVGTGTLTFRFGSYDAGGTTFTPNPERAAKTVTIAAADNSLAGIRDAINAADIGVTAKLVGDSGGYRLVLGSDASGASNAIEVTGIAGLTYSAASKDLTQTIAAADARLVVDGLDIRSATNAVTGVVPGVTLDLKKADPGNPTTLTISRDSSGASAAVKGFVDGYNKFVALTRQLTAYDADSGSAGALLGDATVRGVQSELRRLLGARLTGTDSAFTTLSDIGISTKADGTLALDTARFGKALDADAEGVAGLFAHNGRSRDALIDFVQSGSATVPGRYGVRVDTLATRASLTAGALSSLTVDAGNDTLALRVDGVLSGSVSLTRKTYASGDALAAEIQSRINASSALLAAGASVSVSYAGGALSFTSQRYGSASNIAITAVGTTSAATLGLATATGSAGVDVAGAIGGTTASGRGQRLTANAGGATGIALDVRGGSTGTRGDVTVSDGLVTRLDDYLDAVLGAGGTLEARSQGLDARVKDVDDDRARLETRLAGLEANYRRQFNALDELMSRMQATGNFLTQQLANLGKKD